MQQPTLSALPLFDEIASFQNEICFENICRRFLYNENLVCGSVTETDGCSSIESCPPTTSPAPFFFFFFFKAFQCSCTHPDSNDTFSTEVTFCAYNTNIQTLQSHDSVLQSPTLE